MSLMITENDVKNGYIGLILHTLRLTQGQSIIEAALPKALGKAYEEWTRWIETQEGLDQTSLDRPYDFARHAKQYIVLSMLNRLNELGSNANDLVNDRMIDQVGSLKRHATAEQKAKTKEVMIQFTHNFTHRPDGSYEVKINGYHIEFEQDKAPNYQYFLRKDADGVLPNEVTLILGIEGDKLAHEWVDGNTHVKNLDPIIDYESYKAEFTGAAHTAAEA